MNPKVSVIMSVYNGQIYLKEAIESILGQTFTDFEFIIIDDGSTDNTAKILDTFTDSRIKRIKNEQNSGLIKSLNKSLDIARGEFIARMDADDTSLPDRLQKQIIFMEANKEVGILGTYMEQVDKNGKMLSVFKPPQVHHDIVLSMLSSTAIAHATVVFRQNILGVERYNPNFPHTEDTELWSRLVFKAKFANLPEVLYKRRLHGASIMSKYSKFQVTQSRAVRVKLLESLINKNILTNEEIEKARREMERENDFFSKLLRIFKNILPPAIRHKLRMHFLSRPML